MAAQAPHFGLAPACAYPDVLNYSDQSAAKLFKAGTDALSIKFDCKPDNLQLFLDQARDRSIVFDWLKILSIPSQGDVALSKDLIESYGEISYQDVCNHALTYMHEDTRKAQDSFMMHHCLMNSLTDDAQKQVRTRGNVLPFMFGGKGSGPVLLKVIIMVSHVGTRATITSAMTKLSNLDHAMREQDSGIEHFNDYVIGLVSKLHARGEQTQDLLVNHFKGYKACKDMLNLWNTSRRRKISMKKAVKWTTNNSWIGLSTSSKPGRNQSSGVRELQKRKPSLPYKPKSTP
jgi:hypothetical protein